MSVHAEFMGHPTIWITNRNYVKALDLCEKAGEAAEENNDFRVGALLGLAMWQLSLSENTDIVGDETGYWVYEDNGARAGYGFEQRPCKRCGSTLNVSGKADPCLGRLPGVDNACCGHGDPEAAYIRFTNGVTIRGFTWIDRHMVGGHVPQIRKPIARRAKRARITKRRR